jgi:hypothetical protein
MRFLFGTLKLSRWFRDAFVAALLLAVLYPVVSKLLVRPHRFICTSILFAYTFQYSPDIECDFVCYREGNYSVAQIANPGCLEKVADIPTEVCIAVVFVALDDPLKAKS